MSFLTVNLVQPFGQLQLTCIYGQLQLTYIYGQLQLTYIYGQLQLTYIYGRLYLRDGKKDQEMSKIDCFNIIRRATNSELLFSDS